MLNDILFESSVNTTGKRQAYGRKVMQHSRGETSNQSFGSHWCNTYACGGGGAHGVWRRARQKGAGHRVERQHRGTLVEPRPIQGGAGLWIRLLDLCTVEWLMLTVLGPAAARGAPAETKNNNKRILKQSRREAHKNASVWFGRSLRVWERGGGSRRVPAAVWIAVSYICCVLSCCCYGHQQILLWYQGQK